MTMTKNPTFSTTQRMAYKAATGLWPHEVAGLRRVYVGRGQRRNQLAGLYDGIEAGLDTDGGRWSTVCERHAYICSHDTLDLTNSHVVAPEGWCEACAGTDTERLAEAEEWAAEAGGDEGSLGGIVSVFR